MSADSSEMPMVESLGLRMSACSIPGETARLFSRRWRPLSFASGARKGLRVLARSCCGRFCVRLRVHGRSAEREAAPQCGFNSHSLATNEKECLSHVRLERLYFFDQVLEYFAHYIPFITEFRNSLYIYLCY